MRYANSLLATLFNKIRARRHKPLSRIVWIPVAFVLLGFARAALLTIPFKRIAPLLGHDMQSAAVVPLACQKEISRATHIGHAIRKAAKYTPWESKCLAQAIAARILLGANNLPYALFLGVNTRSDGGLTAHAWVCIGPEALVGGQAFSEYTVVGTFISTKLVLPLQPMKYL